jgi:hypothetical protein
VQKKCEYDAARHSRHVLPVGQPQRITEEQAGDYQATRRGRCPSVASRAQNYYCFHLGRRTTTAFTNTKCSAVHTYISSSLSPRTAMRNAHNHSS